MLIYLFTVAYTHTVNIRQMMGSQLPCVCCVEDGDELCRCLRVVCALRVAAHLLMNVCLESAIAHLNRVRASVPSIAGMAWAIVNEMIGLVLHASWK